jgi:hypothetical protein
MFVIAFCAATMSLAAHLRRALTAVFAGLPPSRKKLSDRCVRKNQSFRQKPQHSPIFPVLTICRGGPASGTAKLAANLDLMQFVGVIGLRHDGQSHVASLCVTLPIETAVLSRFVATPGLPQLAGCKEFDAKSWRD